MICVAGIDLAALEKNPTGAAIYDGSGYHCRTLGDDASIIAFIESHSPSVVAIDAPLTLPRGRCCFDDACCGTRKIRECDRMLISMGYRVFPPGFSHMKKLTMRGKRLREIMEKEGYTVIEAHPRTTLKILGISSLDMDVASEHEADACAAAVMAWLYSKGEYRRVGDDEGFIVIPSLAGRP